VPGDRALEGLLGQGADEVLGAGAVGLLGGGNDMVQEAALRGLGGGRLGLGPGLFSGAHHLPSPAVPSVALMPSSPESFFSSSAFWSTRSSSPSRSSERSTLDSRSRSLSRASRSLRSGSTCWTILPGSKSSIELNLSWTANSPPWGERVFSTLRL